MADPDINELLQRRYKRERNARQQAETLIEQKSLELYTAKLAAEFANRTKTELLANISHELRTPLNAIIGFAEVLHDPSRGLTKEQREYAGYILESGQQLFAVIQQMLEVSQIDVGKRTLSLERFALKGAVETAVAMCRDRAKQAKVAMHIDVAGDVDAIHADPQAVKQILLAVIGNAIKFTPAGGSVGVRVKHDEHDRAEIVVTDTGIGISSEHLSLITQAFFQVDSGLNRRREGTGLGLTIAQSLIDLHNGILHIASRPGAGTEVTIALPLKQMPATSGAVA